VFPQEVVVAAAVRTPIGRYGRQLSAVRPDDLAATTLVAAVERAGIDAAAVDDVILGCANQAGEDNRNVARMAALLAGFPDEVPGQTVNRLCGSGMQALITAAREIQIGAAEVIVAGGVESMSRSPWVMSKPDGGFARGPQKMEDTALGWRLVNPRMVELNGAISLGETAERVAERYGVSRADQDEFALRSHRRAVAALADARFAGEIVPVEVPGRRGETTTVAQDEGPRGDTDLEKLAALHPVFAADGSVTAGNSSPLNDGAAALVLCSAAAAERHGLRPLARFLDGAAAGVDPNLMGIGPVPATQRLLAREGAPALADFERFELNEAFASQALASQRELGIEPELVNVNGGAIALGHPLGASGARIVTTLLHELRRSGSRYGLAAMCIGVGQGIASAWERLDG